jgi:ABC-2 type transport system ATP-binding protein
MGTVLKISDLNKRYGHLQAVSDLSLEVEKGSVYGILGPNGSGKTTTLGIILGAIHATSGSFEWFGQPLNNRVFLRIGALLEQPNIYPYLSAENNLKIVADIKQRDYSNIGEMLTLVNLHERRKDKVKNYSFGMRQRLVIASALLCNPEVLVLDEPTNGLDPQGIADVRDLIRRVAERGITIVIASHLLDEVEKVCSHVAILKSGMVLATGAVRNVLSSNSTVELAAENEPLLLSALAELSYLKDISHDGRLLTAKLLDETITGERINRDLMEKGIILSHLLLRKQSLESYFLDLTKNKN